MGRDGTLTVIGQGYVGLPLAMLAVETGYRVVGIDLDASCVARLRRGESYVDDVDDAQLEAALGSGCYTASTDCADAAGFAVAVTTVPTPLRERSPDLSFVTGAAQQIAPHITPGSLVVLESTTYPGTNEDLVRPIIEEGSGLTAGRDFALGYSPERVDPGNRTWALASMPRAVGVAGCGQGVLRQARRGRRPLSSARAAEMTKLLENTFRHVNIALVNEFAIFARELGIDSWEVVRGASAKPFGFMSFRPGPGVGGRCLPIDPVYLSWDAEQETGRRFRFVDVANDINDQMPGYVVQRIAGGLNRQGMPVLGARIMLLGLAYRRNSSDPRESPTAPVARLLASLGAQVARWTGTRPPSSSRQRCAGCC